MNREITSTLWPLSGDVSTQAGSRVVTVTGINSIPIVSSFMIGGETLVYNINTGQWVAVNEDVLSVNGMPTGDDPYISVNVSPLVKVNGV
jgi:hypothetical protein